MKTVVNLESGSSDGSTSLVMYGSEEDCVEYAFPLQQKGPEHRGPGRPNERLASDAQYQEPWTGDKILFRLESVAGSA
jgi:hypothetical protein